MQRYPLSTIERQQGGFTDRFVLTHADLTETADATAQAITLCALPAGTLVRNAALRLVTKFQNTAEAGNNTTAMSLGDGGSAARYITSTELNVNGTEVVNKAGTGTQLAFDSAGSLIATFAAAAAATNHAELDTGEVHIFVQLVDLIQLAGS